jgi:hypothetical protein
LVDVTTDKNGKQVRVGDRIVFYKWSEWLGLGRTEGTVLNIVRSVYGEHIHIIEDGQRTGSLAWGRSPNEVEVKTG